jgi:hypothetical protein
MVTGIFAAVLKQISKIANFKRDYFDNDNDSEFTGKTKNAPFFNEFSEYTGCPKKTRILPIFGGLKNTFFCYFRGFLESKHFLDAGFVFFSHFYP